MRKTVARAAATIGPLSLALVLFSAPVAAAPQ